MNHLSQSTTTLDISLFGLLETINHPPSGVAFVTDDAAKLIGVITDGDVRRWLLDGNNLDTSLRQIKLEPFTYALVGESMDDILAKTTNKIRLLPIVDEQMKLVDYLQLDRRINIPVAAPDLGGNELRYVTDALLSTWISSAGSYITTFEEGFADYCGTKYGVAVSNGTVAIHLALIALGVGPGDEVIVPDFTFAATINAVLHAGATPVIVDVDYDSWCIDPKEIEKAITPKTKAMIPVHIYGQPCDMDPIMEISRKHDLFVIEDAAEAHGATYKGQRVGSFGHVATFSFFANKIITTGEGGICMTSDPALNEEMRVLRDHGMNKQRRYWHDKVGYNYRMTNIQAAIGCAQLERIDEIIDGRAKLEDRYRKSLESCDFLEFQAHLPERKRTIWLISVLIQDALIRERFMDFFKSRKIDIRPFFFPLGDMPIFAPYRKEKEGGYVSQRLSKVGVSLPTFTAVNIERFEEVLHEFLADLKSSEVLVG